MAGESSYHGGGDFVLTYVNGLPGMSAKPGDTIKLGDKPVKALFLRIINTGMEQTYKRDKNDVHIAYETFPPDAHVTIKEITVFNDKGKPMRLMPPRRVHGTITASSTPSQSCWYMNINMLSIVYPVRVLRVSRKAIPMDNWLIFQYQRVLRRGLS